MLPSFRSKYAKYSTVKGFDPFTAGFLGIILLLAMTGFDVLLHDTLVLPTYQCDDPKYSGLDICKAVNEKTTFQANISGTEFQYQITGRQNYWIALNLILIFTAFVPAFVRSLLGSIKAGFLYFLSGILPVLGGFEDLIYYSARGIPLPETMPWLNSNPFINLFANGEVVTPTILYTSMAAVVVILAIAWTVALKVRK